MEAQPRPIVELLERVQQVYGPEGVSIRAGSPADIESREYSSPTAVTLAYSYGVMALMSAQDHMEAVDLVVQMGQPSVAHWTCLRGLLEAASLAAWLFDRNISATERVGRSLALRYNTLTQQRKMADSDGDSTIVADIDDRIDAIESDATSLGFPLIRDKNGVRDGIGQRKPHISSLIETEFDLRNTYRFLCGIAHCDSAVVADVGFRQVHSGDGTALLERDDDADKLRMALAHAAMLYAKPLWAHVVQFGLDEGVVSDALEQAFSALGINEDPDVRFWRSDPAVVS